MSIWKILFEHAGGQMEGGGRRELGCSPHWLVWGGSWGLPTQTPQPWGSLQEMVRSGAGCPPLLPLPPQREQMGRQQDPHGPTPYPVLCPGDLKTPSVKGQAGGSVCWHPLTVQPCFVGRNVG